MPTTPIENPPPPLAALRDDLKLLRGPSLENGSPTWTLHDPVRNAFFRIGRREFEMLSRWHIRVPESLAESVNQDTTLRITAQDVRQFETFLITNALARADRPDIQALLKAKINRPQPGGTAWLLKNYLFFRIPVCNPDRFLEATLPLARLLVSVPVLWLLGSLGFLGLVMAMRQWEAFIHTFPYFFSLPGLLLYAMAILFSKLCHELGHAYTAKHYGLHVPTMGIAFLVLWPVLYSDNSEAWKLRRRRARVNIVAAGTLVELVLALLATFMWSFLPDGPAKSACFVMATVTWISSLFINMSPFLRFDGYYLLSDLWEVPNLHARAFALGKWQLRKTLLGFSAPCPERFPPRKQRILILFAYLTWLYRLVLFTGIALFIYSLVFKALGIVLFGVQILGFLVLPLKKEIAFWWQNRSRAGLNGRLLTTLLGAAILAALIIAPVSTQLRVPALLKPGAPYKIFPPFSARIAAIQATNGRAVQAGDLLFTFESPHLDHNICSLRTEVAMLETLLKSFRQERQLIDHQHVVFGKLAEARTRLAGYLEEQCQLRLTAPADGIVMDLPEGLAPGTWINANQCLAVLVKRDHVVMEGYPDENQLARIDTGDSARFYAESGDLPPVDGSVASIDQTSSRVLEEPYLASLYGGGVPVRLDQGRMVSDKSISRVILKPDGDASQLPNRIQRGRLVIQGRTESPLARAYRRIASVLIRESGF